MHGRGENPFFGVAPFNLTHAMTELVTLGVPLTDVVATVTINPARMLRMEDRIGSLQPGREADVSVLEMLDGRFRLTDNSGETVIAPAMLRPVFALRAGRMTEVESPLVPSAALLAA